MLGRHDGLLNRWASKEAPRVRFSPSPPCELIEVGYPWFESMSRFERGKAERASA